MLSYIRQAKDSGLAVIFITHNMYHAYPVSDRIVVLEHGRKVLDCRKEEGSLEEIASVIMGEHDLEDERNDG